MSRKILWLASWYPNRLRPYDGDFIKRHAEAVSLYEEVQVICVVRDEEGLLTRGVLVEETKNGNLAETIIYYYVSESVPLVKKFISALKFRKLFRNAAGKYIRERGLPSLVHVHVGMKAGLVALSLLKRYGTPYVLTEHWTGFLDEAGSDNFDRLPLYYRLAWKKVARSALSVSHVSLHLSNAYLRKIPCRHLRIIPNVVNTTIFNPGSAESSLPVQFIHISGMDERKNPRQILEAFKIVLEKFPDALLKIFGTESNSIADMIRQMGLDSKVQLHGESPQPVLARHIHESTSLILYSSCETFGCVIIEANACGVPVIVSDIPVFHETVTEAENGYFAKPNDPGALAERMLEMIKNRLLFDSVSIASITAAKYGYATVGKHFSLWYDEVLGL